MRLGGGALALGRVASPALALPALRHPPARAARHRTSSPRAFSRDAPRGEDVDAPPPRPSPHFAMSRKERKALMRPYEPTRAERRLAAALLEETGEGLGAPLPHDVAFLVADVPTELGGTKQVVWFASAPKDAKPWLGPVARLVLGVREAAFSADVDAHRWVRNRVLTTNAPGELERAIVKVAASKVARVVPEERSTTSGTKASRAKKRTTYETDEGLNNFSDDDDDALCLLPRYDANRWAEFGVRRGARDSREVLPKEVSQIERDGTKEDDARLFAWAEAFVKSKKLLLDEEQLPFHKRDRGVVAMLVSRDGALLDCAVNTNNSNTALHAEVNLLAPWLEGFLEEEQQEDGDDETLDETDASPTFLRGKRNGRLPAGARVLVTLQCCRMCAALICAASDDALTRDGVETLREVVYAEADEGKYSNETALQSRGWERAFSREEEANAES